MDVVTNYHSDEEESSNGENSVEDDVNEDIEEDVQRGDEPVMDDLAYIASFADVQEDYVLAMDHDDAHHDAEMNANDEEDDEDVSLPAAPLEDMPEEGSEDEDEEDTEEEETEISQDFRKKLKDMLTEEEDDSLPCGPPRSKHEVEEEAIEPLAVDRLDQARHSFQAIGTVLSYIDHEKTMLIKAYITYAPLKEGSLLCSEEGAVLGAVQEVFGPVTEPFYIVRFPKDSVTTAITTLFTPNTTVYTAKEHASFLTASDVQALKTIKGSDASNAFDEEPGEDEVEYSDDEEEQAAKKAKKVQKARAAAPSMDAIPPGPRAKPTRPSRNPGASQQPNQQPIQSQQAAWPAYPQQPYGMMPMAYYAPPPYGYPAPYGVPPPPPPGAYVQPVYYPSTPFQPPPPPR